MSSVPQRLVLEKVSPFKGGYDRIYLFPSLPAIPPEFFLCLLCFFGVQSYLLRFGVA